MSDAVASQRRVYSGAATFKLSEDGEEVLAGGLVAEVPGRQTVPRAELWGAALLANAAPADGPFEITLDAAYVTNGLSRRGDRFRGANGDLWTILARIIDDRAGETSISKVKSHVLEEQLEQVANRQHCWRHVVGNELADASADTGPALFSQDVGAASRRARHIEDKAATIACRLARIQARIWEFSRGAAVYEPPTPAALDPTEKEPDHAARDIISTINSKGHHLEGWNSGFRCVRCGVKRGWRNKGYFTTTKCKPNLPAQEVVKRLRTQPLTHPASPPPHTDLPCPANPSVEPPNVQARGAAPHHDEDNPRCPSTFLNDPPGNDAAARLRTPRQEDQDAWRKRRRRMDDDVGLSSRAGAAHASLEDLDQPGDGEIEERDGHGPRDSDGDQGMASLTGNHTESPRGSAGEVAPQSSVPRAVANLTHDVGEPAGVDDSVHGRHSRFPGNTTHAYVASASPAGALADRTSRREQGYGNEGYFDDHGFDGVFKGKDDERYGKNSNGHTGDYTAVHLCGYADNGDYKSDGHARSAELDDDAAHAAKGDAQRTAHARDDRRPEDIPVDHYDYDFDDLQDWDEHPFDCPPNEDELHSLHGGDGQSGTSRAASSGDPSPVISQREGQLLVPRRRLTGKTNPVKAAEMGHAPPAGDSPPGRELVTREVARAARLRLREAAEVHGRAAKSARGAAWVAIRHQPEIVAAGRDGFPAVQGATDANEAHGEAGSDGHIPLRWRAHVSHDILAAPGAQMIYCRRCGAWSLGERSTNLTRPCSLKQGHKGNLRLLSLGIVPRRGARVPAELKQAGARGTRGGLVVRRAKRRGSR